MAPNFADESAITRAGRFGRNGARRAETTAAIRGRATRCRRGPLPFVLLAALPLFWGPLLLRRAIFRFAGRLAAARRFLHAATGLRLLAGGGVDQFVEIADRLRLDAARVGPGIAAFEPRLGGL